MYRQTHLSLQCIALLLVFSPLTTRAELDQYGTYVEAAADEGFPFNLGLNTYSGMDGGVTVKDASYSSHGQILLGDDAGRVSASAELSDSTSLEMPTLRARAESFHETASSYSRAVAIQGFIYSEMAQQPGDFDLELALTGSVVAAPGREIDTGIVATAAVFTGEFYEFDTSNTFEYEFFNGSDTTGLFMDSNSSNGSPMGTTLSFTMQPGDTIYLAAELYTYASGQGSDANSSSTFVTNITSSDPVALANLSSATSAAIPEPSPILLLGLLGCALGLRRRLLLSLQFGESVREQRQQPI